MILSAIAEKLRRRSKDDFRGRHFEAPLILQAVCWYLRYPLSWPNLRAHCRTVSWLTMMLRVASISSTMRKLSGKRKYSQTAWLMTSARKR